MDIPRTFFFKESNMSAQLIELQEVTLFDVSDELLEVTAIAAGTTYTGIYYCVYC